jgi:hypothetical protein
MFHVKDPIHIKDPNVKIGLVVFSLVALGSLTTYVKRRPTQQSQSDASTPTPVPAAP